MPQVTFSVRMDSEVKAQFDEFCEKIGMNVTTAFNIFARAALRENRIPFELIPMTDPFYSESNLRHIRESISALNAGKGVHKTLDELLEMEECD